jgi:hypothetical protein
MSTSYTSLLGLALPVTGELSGTWGDTVNNSITSLLDSAIAGTQTVTADTTLTTTTGAANQSRQAILLCSPASANITITAPAQSKIYTVINTSATYTVKIVGVGPTAGVTLAVSESAVVAWNGSDFIRISSNSATTGNFTVNGNLSVTGNTTLGDASTDTVTVNGYMGIGGAGNAARAVSISSSVLTGASQIGYDSRPVFSSAATTNGLGVFTAPRTAATAFTMTDAVGYYANDWTKGAGSTITNQHGIYIDNQTTGTNNYGITSTVSSGTNKWNIYASGTAQNYFAGNVGIGVTPSAWGSTYKALQINYSAIWGNPANTTIRFSTNTYNNGTNFIYLTSNYATYYSQDTGSHIWYNAPSGTAGNTITFTQAMTLDANGSLGLGTTSLTGISLGIGKTITGATTSYGVLNNGTIQSDVTTGIGYGTSFSTNAAVFNIDIRHYDSSQATIGAGSIVASQYGFITRAALTGATNNYSFFGNIAAPTAGIATTGTITSISSSTTTVTVNHNAITYTNGQTVTISATANATALVSGATCTILTVGTTDFTLIGAASNTVGVSFTASGAGTGTGTVTLNVQGSGKTVAGAASGSFTYTTTTSQTFTAVTVLTGSVTVSTRYNLYMAGTADNYIAGNVGIGTTTPATILNAYNATSAIISVDGDATCQVRASRYSTDTSLPQFIARKARGTLASPSAVATSDVAGGLFIQAYGGTNFRNIARVDGFVETYTSDTNIAGALRFFTNTSTTDVTEKMRIDSNGNVLVTNVAGLGYGTGAGGTVTQATSRTTGVTLSKPTGAITMFSAAGSTTAATFTVTNTLVAATDTIILNQKSGTNLYVLLVTAVAAGSFNITFYTTGGTASDAPVINFSVIKGVTT